MRQFIVLLFGIPVLFFCGAMCGYGAMKKAEPHDARAFLFFVVVAVIATIVLAAELYRVDVDAPMIVTCSDGTRLESR